MALQGPSTGTVKLHKGSLTALLWVLGPTGIILTQMKGSIRSGDCLSGPNLRITAMENEADKYVVKHKSAKLLCTLLNQS